MSCVCPSFFIQPSFPPSLSMKITFFSATTPCSLTYTYLGPTDNTEVLTCPPFFTTYLHSADSKTHVLRNTTNFDQISWLRIPDESSFVGNEITAWIIFILILIAIFQSYLFPPFFLCLLLCPPVPSLFLYLQSYFPSSFFFPSCMFPFSSHTAPLIALVLFPFLIFALLFFSRQLVNWPRYKLHTSHKLHYPARWHILIHVLLPCISFPATANCAKLQTYGYVTTNQKSTFRC